jgi:hypothetical protein
VIQLIGYPENIRVIDPRDRSAVFQAWGAVDFVEDYTDEEIVLVYDPKKVLGAPTRPPLGYQYERLQRWAGDYPPNPWRAAPLAIR